MAKRYNKMTYLYIIILSIMIGYTLLYLYFEHRLDKRKKEFKKLNKTLKKWHENQKPTQH